MNARVIEIAVGRSGAVAIGWVPECGAFGVCGFAGGLVVKELHYAADARASFKSAYQNYRAARNTVMANVGS